MEAEWYVDPLGRYEGRFFDGVRWTDRVSDDGVLSHDPLFDLDETEQSDAERAEPVSAGDAPAAIVSENAPDDPGFGGSDAVAAVLPVGGEGPRRASAQQESPARLVATVDPTLRPTDGPPQKEPAPTAGRRFGLATAAAVLAVVALAVAGMAVVLDDSDSASEIDAEPIALDADEAERVEDLQDASETSVDPEQEQGEPLEVDLPRGAVGEEAVFGPEESLTVGSLTVLNATSVLGELGVWHAESAARRGIELGPDAGCWFGELGGAAVQVAHCGPVGETSEGEFRFDLVPLRFENRDGGQVAQPVIDSVTLDSVISTRVELIAGPDGARPPSAPLGDRGDRNGDADADD